MVVLELSQLFVFDGELICVCVCVCTGDPIQLVSHPNTDFLLFKTSGSFPTMKQLSRGCDYSEGRKK